MIYPAHIQWNGSTSGHVARPQASTTTLTRPVRGAVDDASAVPRPTTAPTTRSSLAR